ncbi:hypothetical protein [Rubrobacter indicoceani]|uniref:hypothetical protein n=1 Tax=Rubrobacter indicoceani TaxID=2051957 RepID=UPI000E5A6157|nr:hypothetical protein [Rubrobacter indicoceani]
MPEALPRLGGLLGVTGGLLWAGQGLLGGGFPATLLFIAPLLMAAGLAGFYLLHRERSRGLGQSGFTQGMVGLGMLAFGFFGAYTLGEEPLLRVASFGFLVTAFGLVLTGYACIKEGLLPRLDWLPLALGAVAPLGLLFGDAGAVGLALALLFGSGWVLFGAAVALNLRHGSRPGQ